MPWRDPLFARSRSWPHRPRNRAQLLENQASRLRSLIAHARWRVPFYRRHWQGVDVDRWLTEPSGALAEFPLVERRDLQGVAPELRIASGYEPTKLVERKTSGSSGQPLSVRMTRFEKILDHAQARIGHRELGWRPGARVVSVGSSAQPGGLRPSLTSFLRILGDFRPEPLEFRQPVDQFAQLWQARAPDVLVGVAGHVAELAFRLDAAGLRPRPPRALWLGGEMLQPSQRRTISRVFGAPVRDIYGSWEAGPIAWQCPLEPELMHIGEAGSIVEVLDDDRPVAEGESGIVTITTLHRYAMPFIRYAQGDIAVRGPTPCPCGAPWATLRGIRGRQSDRLHLPDGRTLHPADILVAMEAHVEQVRQYRLVQTAPDAITVEVVPAGVLCAASEAALIRSLAAVWGDRMRVKVESLDVIETGPSGKFRVVCPLET